MKKKFPLSLVFLLSCIFAQAEELSETRLLEPFNEIIATNGVNITLRKGSENKADIRISNAMLSDLVTEVKNNKLKIKLRPQINKELTVMVTITYQQLKAITASKGASIQTRTVMLTDNLSFTSNTGGNIKAEVECKNIEISAIGGGKAALYGWTERLDCKASTKASIDTKKLVSEKALAKATGGGEIWLNPQKYLEAICSTGGTIYYINKAEKINERLSSGGELISKVSEQRIGYDLIKDKASK